MMSSISSGRTSWCFMVSSVRATELRPFPPVRPDGMRAPVCISEGDPHAGTLMGKGGQLEVERQGRWHAHQQNHHDENGGDPLDARPPSPILQKILHGQFLCYVALRLMVLIWA